MSRKSYHFDLGNSNTGPIGYCARVWASSEDEAVAILKENIAITVAISDGGDERIEYIEGYINLDAITKADIDEIRDETGRELGHDVTCTKCGENVPEGLGACDCGDDVVLCPKCGCEEGCFE